MFPKPDDLFKQSFAQWEKQTASFWNNLLRDPDFLRTAWHNVEMGLQAQQQMNQMAEQVISTWQLPPRDQQEHHQLNRLQIMLNDLHERVDSLQMEIDGLVRD